ncbi:GNAT family N-acetyltransferase [Agromyces archimandritae]|uniref:GNAT family N-acetyltransferase n=2 Tax=Agromyces archimandritae TaxID=2781962 RepID=A0A975IMV7_9MICO|nr:GNAT family N-acetyltransferase [Agromyces archimandritae]QTX03875.1 GNAT family N-acetyltransferase [Agromyces archimandritae]
MLRPLSRIGGGPASVACRGFLRFDAALGAPAPRPGTPPLRHLAGRPARRGTGAPGRVGARSLSWRCGTDLTSRRPRFRRSPRRAGPALRPRRHRRPRRLRRLAAGRRPRLPRSTAEPCHARRRPGRPRLPPHHRRLGRRRPRRRRARRDRVELARPPHRLPGRTLEAWAISSVTVAPTHRRRGIARALLEGELRTAHAAGMPLAMLTVTEATIYGRYGFSPASLSADLAIERRRVHWTGPTPPGRVRFVEPAELAPIALDVSNRAALRTPGEIERWPSVVDRMLGLVEPDSEASRRIRTARYDAADGSPQGFAVYRVAERDGADARLELRHLVTVTDDAERALWRFIVEHDGIGEIRAGQRSIAESLPWMLEDRRAVRIEHAGDALWLRILDPVASLQSRRYSTPGELLLAVRDGAGFADGTYRLEADGDGRAHVSPVEPSWDSDRPTLRLGVGELGSILLGGVRPSVLHEAGRVEANSAEVLRLADRMFAPARMPHLGLIF